MLKAELVLILVYLSGRLFFCDINLITQPHKPSGQKKAVLKRIVLGFAAFVLLEHVDIAVMLILMHSLLILIDTFFVPKQSRGAKTIYICHLIFGIIIFPMLLKFLVPFMPAWQNPLLIALFDYLRSFILTKPFFYSGNLNRIILILIGFVFTLKEGTVFIRLTLNRISAIPVKKSDPKKEDSDEYERGKLIGLLERTFIYFLVIFNQIGGIAIIVALKSLARFKELDDKNFAEYFLIGSFLSLLMGVTPAVIIRIILN